MSEQSNSDSSVSGSQDCHSSRGSGSTDSGICYDWISIKNFVIYDPLLVLLCIWAAYIAYTGFKLLFLMYGVMMSFAMITNSLAYDYSGYISIVSDVIDMDLTSTIATFFLYCGLSDVGLINSNSTKSKLVFLVNSIIILICWIFTIFYSSDENLWVTIMYEGVVGLSCGSYLILELVYLKKSNNLKSIVWLLSGGFVGCIGLGIALYAKQWCAIFGPRLNPSYAWFLLSDIAMILISKYIIASNSHLLKDPSQYIKKSKNTLIQQQQPLLISINWEDEI